MLPFQRNKVDLSVSVPSVNDVSYPSLIMCSAAENEPSGATAVCQVWQATHSQERSHEDAESVYKRHLTHTLDLHSTIRSVNTLILEITLSQRLE